jgi:hypothetical protein
VRNESGNTNILHGLLKVHCPGEPPALRRTPNSNNNTASVKSNGCRNIFTTAHRPPHTSAFSSLNGPSQRIIQEGHQKRQPTSDPRDRDSGNETAKLTETNGINDSRGASSKTLNRPKETAVETTAVVACQTTADVASDQHREGSETQRPGQCVPTDPPVHSLKAFQLCARESATRRHREPTARQSIEHLSRRGRTAQAGGGPNRTQRPDSETGRKRQYADETSDKREHEVSALVTDETKGKADCSACGASANADFRADRFETSGQNNNIHVDIEGGQEDYSAGKQGKRALSTGDRIKQVENPASVKNEGIQRFSNGELETAQTIPLDKRNTVGLTKHPAGNEARTGEGCAQQVTDNFATAEQQDSVTAGKSAKFGQDAGTMSTRPQILKVTDSVTTAFRRRDGDKHVSFK